MNKTLEPKDYLEIGWRRKWSFIIPFVLVSVLAVGYFYWAPKIYRASTLILVEAQKLPTDYVKPTVEQRVEVQLQTITEQVMSRTYLERVINELNLYPGLRKTLHLESVIRGMRQRITVEVKKSQVFSISFMDEDPVSTMKVANRLASLFIEENLKVREELAEGTLVFLDRELERVQALLKQQEGEVSKFRAKYLGMLPEQLEANLRTLERLQEELKSTTQALIAAQENRALLQQQLAQMRSTYSARATQQSGPSGEARVEPADTAQLEAQLENLRLKYTDEHPEVIRLKRQIAMIAKKEGNEEKKTAPSNPSPSPSPWQAQTTGQIARLNIEIAQHKAEIGRLRALIKEYDRRVESTPKVEQQLKELTRGYEVTQTEYQSLLDKRLQAELAANMERKQKGERFKVLDPAKIPEIPVKPDRQKIMLFGTILAMMAGAGLVAAMEYFDTSFRKIEDLESLTDLPVIAVIPDIKETTKKAAERRR